MTNMLGRVDVEVQVSGGGPVGQAGAIRYALSVALQSFANEETIERMRLGNSRSLIQFHSHEIN